MVPLSYILFLLLLDGALIRLPGTQPGMAAPADGAGACASCHRAEWRAWRSGAMSHAARDPVFNALLSITNARTLPLGLDAGEYCLRCHAPNAWLAGRSHDLSTQNFTATDLEGVQCDFCHRAVDPLDPPQGAAVSGAVPGRGNGMFVVMPTGEPRRSPRGSTRASHPTAPEPFLASSGFCGTCHEVSNPYFHPDPAVTPPAHQPALERTYSEWALSWYAGLGATGTCQSCHMPAGDGAHGFAGGNTFLLRIMPRFSPETDSAATAGALARAEAMHRRAARLEAVAGRGEAGNRLLVRITNLTGHKLPTGFAEGRRIWLEVRAFGPGGSLRWSSGVYDHASGSLQDSPAPVVFEAHLGPSAATAAQVGIPFAAGYHAALSDSVWMDTRIPPRGFRRATFESARAAPVPVLYADGQYWSVAEFHLPEGVESVAVRLLYQQVSPAFARFLRDENAANPYDWNRWGERVYEAWREHGGPAELAAVRVGVGEGDPVLGEFRDPVLPLVVRLEQNYPNPFNAGTRIRYAASLPVSNARLRVVDMAGREVARLLEGVLPAGEGEVEFVPRDLASGVYLVRLEAGPAAVTKKMLLLR